MYMLFKISRSWLYPFTFLHAMCFLRKPFVFSNVTFVFFIGKKKKSKSEENLLTPKQSNDSSHRLSWTGPHALGEVCDDRTPLSGYLYAGNCYSEPVLVTGKPPAMPKEIKSVTDNSSKENWREDSLCGDEECEAQNTVRRITQAFVESASDLNAFVSSKSSASEPQACISEPQTDSETLLTVSVMDSNHKTCTSEPQTECDIPWSNKDCDGDANETSLEENVDQHFTALKTPAKSLKMNADQNSPEVVLKIVEETNMDSPGLTDISYHKLECDVDVFESSSGNSSINVDFPAPEKVVDMVKSDNYVPVFNKENCSLISQDIHSIPAPVRRTCRVSDHIQHFNRLCLNDHGIQKVKSPIKFQRTPVRQSVRRINSLSEVKKCVDHERAKEVKIGSPMVKSVSCDGSLSSELFSNRSSHRLFSAGSRENSSSCEHLPTVPVRRASSRFSKQTFANAPSSVLSSVNPVKSVFEDLTNQVISRPTCTKPDLSTNGSNNALRILSSRAHNRYRGSPKNPIGKVTFLPASKPLDL